MRRTVRHGATWTIAVPASKEMPAMNEADTDAFLDRREHADGDSIDCVDANHPAFEGPGRAVIPVVAGLSAARRRATGLCRQWRLHRAVASLRLMTRMLDTGRVSKSVSSPRQVRPAMSVRASRSRVPALMKCILDEHVGRAMADPLYAVLIECGRSGIGIVKERCRVIAHSPGPGAHARGSAATGAVLTPLLVISRGVDQERQNYGNGCGC